jgi:hypothetical protein
MTGPFVFFDLRTPDVAVSRAFYTELADLTVTEVPAGTGSATVALWQEAGQ